MIRNLVLAAVLLPSLVLSQGMSKGQGEDPAKLRKQRTNVLDTAAKTPFFTQKGADAVKRVITGADTHKDDEKATDPLDSKSQGGAPSAKPQPGQPGPTDAGAATKQQPVPEPEPTFAWRLIGISYGSKHGMALFRDTASTKSVGAGASLDTDTKIVSITRSRVVLVFHGKRLELIPW